MSERNMRKTTVGKVVSNKMDKTIVVAVEDSYRHPLYNKIIKRTVKRKAHDEENVCGIGDRVRIMETRPLSKDKRWRLVEIIEKAKQSALAEGGIYCDSAADLPQGGRQHRSEGAYVHPRSR